MRSNDDNHDVEMRPLKLHSKTTLLASLITVGMLAAALVVTSASIANLEREDDIVLAEIQARDLAQQVGNMPVPRDQDALARAVTLIKDSRPNIVSVRIWERSGDDFVERIASPAEHPPDAMPAAVRQALLDPAKAIDKTAAGSDPTLHREYARTFFAGRVNGAVEIVERFDSIWSVVFRYLKGAVWMALTAVALITLGTYLLFRRLVYQPLDRLINAMSRAKTGDLEAQVPASAADEIGVLTDEFNSMIRQVREMTREREAQQVTLREKVRDATNELERRNQQLQETNLELWRTTRRMNELGRLAAAGQTAAQFAHEVGTPLNLISGHVQLLKSDLERDPRDAEARIRTISAQIERIERIVRRMLDKTRFETELSPLDMTALLRRLCEAMSPAFDKR
ncbi:MAG TPA: histidine kinase dimerization/phospho-acceptor domain-containing protein, partial [Pyrinomonadaceae bacterium]|nr:histidine kinase dimerization/phospho-acceptor domain-containing protein [Pyrinomonadaceae bacterium]